MQQVTKMEVYTRVLRDTARDAATDEGVLWIMQVLHSHAIRVSPDAIVVDVAHDGPHGVELAALTRSHLALLVASVFEHDDDVRRRRREYWGLRFDEETGYEVFEDVPEGLRPRAEAARRAVAAHELVAELVPD